jgi:hypothetical protein
MTDFVFIGKCRIEHNGDTFAVVQRQFEGGWEQLGPDFKTEEGAKLYVDSMSSYHRVPNLLEPIYQKLNFGKLD